jgi:hypothetical protein
LIRRWVTGKVMAVLRLGQRFGEFVAQDAHGL